MDYLINSKGQRRFIVNQDREWIKPLTTNIYTTTLFRQEEDGELIPWSIDVNMSVDDYTVVLGTFDSIAQAIQEINSILASDDEVYMVNGYEEWSSIVEELADLFDN